MLAPPHGRLAPIPCWTYHKNCHSLRLRMNSLPRCKTRGRGRDATVRRYSLRAVSPSRILPPKEGLIHSLIHLHSVERERRLLCQPLLPKEALCRSLSPPFPILQTRLSLTSIRRRWKFTTISTTART